MRLHQLVLALALGAPRLARASRLPLFALPVLPAPTAGAAIGPEPTFIEFHRGNLPIVVARNWCRSAEGGTFDPEGSLLPAAGPAAAVATAAGAGSGSAPFKTCQEHVTQCLEILRDQVFEKAKLREAHWSWARPSRERDGLPLPSSLGATKAVQPYFDECHPTTVVVHHVWLGTAPFPAARHARLRTRWLALHPDDGLEVRVWRHADVMADDRLQVTQQLLHHHHDPRFLSDVLRLELLWYFGGIYADLDVVPVQSFLPLVTNACGGPSPHLVLGLEDPSQVSNSVLISPRPRHTFVGILLQNVRRWVRLHAGHRACVMSGPEFLTQGVRDMLEDVRREQSAVVVVGADGRTDGEVKGERRRVILLPRRGFNPVHFSQLTPGTLTVEGVAEAWEEQQQQQEEEEEEEEDQNDPDVGGSSRVLYKTYAVQGWQSQVQFVPIKIEILRLRPLAVEIKVFPWQGARLMVAGRPWRVCAQWMSPDSEPACVGIGFERTFWGLRIVLPPRPRKSYRPSRSTRGFRDRISLMAPLRAWVETPHKVPLSRSSVVWTQ